MSATIRVISIGTLAANPHWGERGAVRPAHATTTLIVSGSAKILVDPSLPPQVIVPRLVERAGIGPDDITHVFLTCLNPIHRRGILARGNGLRGRGGGYCEQHRHEHRQHQAGREGAGMWQVAVAKGTLGDLVAEHLIAWTADELRDHILAKGADEDHQRRRH